jgi:hypothetical protein
MIFSAADFGAFVVAESEKWEKVIQFAGIKPESDPTFHNVSLSDSGVTCLKGGRSQLI